MKNKIIFLGDISLNDKYKELYQKGEKPFDGVKDILFNSEFVVGNLECMSKGEKGENLLKKPRLKTNTETLNYLKDINLGLALLAHNHVYDNLEDGFLKTIQFLDANDIAHIGAGLSPEEAEKPFIKDFNGIKICILNYVTHDTNPNLPKDATVYPNWFEETKVITDIKKYKETCDKVILCLHWGGRCEGGKLPDWNQPFIARRLIDAGADLIVGNHSHTIQPFEEYKGKMIYYSLGNFCFSPYPEIKIQNLHPNSRKGLFFIYNFSKNQFQNYNVSNNRQFLTYTNKVYSKNLLFNLIWSHILFWNIYYFLFRKIKPIFDFVILQDGNIFQKVRRLNLQKLRKFIKN
jgi:poly-gamma-glutamate synthesis protein (capsule biosynthesis protein)